MNTQNGQRWYRSPSGSNDSRDHEDVETEIEDLVKNSLDVVDLIVKVSKEIEMKLFIIFKVFLEKRSLGFS